MECSQLEIAIYQIVDDSFLKKNRADGTGWDWCWADWQRDWMDATPNRYAYRCLPLTIANQTGWWVKNPVGFAATWNGQTTSESIQFRFDAAGDVWKNWINSQFGEGIITWNTPFLFRTKPEGSRLLVCGPPNFFKTNAHPLTALIESDWMSMSFTMNWKIMTPNLPVRFEAGEPLFQVIPLLSNVCADLETASVTYRRLIDDSAMNRAYNEWNQSRREFHELKAKGGVKPDDWQKDYFHGRDMTGREVAPAHRIKVKPPTVQDLTRPSSERGNGLVTRSQPQARLMETLANRSTAQAPAQAAPSVATMEREAEASAEPAESTIETERTAPGPAAIRVTDEWRRWIAENLTLEMPPETIVSAMTASGIDPREAALEVERASESPYLKGTARLRNRLRKRDWLLATYRKCNRLDPETGTIPRRSKLARREFIREYYSTNRPVIITGMMDDWPALGKWNLDFFAQRFGDREVEVQAGRTLGDNYEVEREKYLRRMPFSEFVEKVRTAGVSNDFYLTANNNSSNKKALPELWDDIVQIPEYLDGGDRLGGFFWFGPAGTITPFHHDLTNNFMAQVLGRKRVKVVPSWDIPLMNNDFHCYSKSDGRHMPPTLAPALEQPQVLECILNPGEILFLPIGCMHFVEGLDISVTVSFTNFAFDNDFSSFYTTYHEL